MMKKSTPKYFWSRVRVGEPDECWEWTGPPNSGGAGQVMYRNTKWKSNRLAYFLTYGEIPAGMRVGFYCRNRACCNPNHLYAGTQKQIQMNSRIYGGYSGKHQEGHIRRYSDTMRRLDNYNEIFRLRKQGLSFSQIGKRVGYSLSGVSRIINGNRSARLSQIVRKDG